MFSTSYLVLCYGIVSMVMLAVQLPLGIFCPYSLSICWLIASGCFERKGPQTFELEEGPSLAVPKLVCH